VAQRPLHQLQASLRALPNRAVLPFASLPQRFKFVRNRERRKHGYAH
jgi:hypothetical protein